MRPTPPATPASVGADRVLDSEVVGRAARARALDRRVLRAAKRISKWLAVLALVVVPVACLVIPTCTMRFPCRSKQSEAKGNLRALYVAQETYRAEFDHYTDDARALAWTPRGAQLRYDYFVKLKNHADDDPKNDGFDLWAIGVADEVQGDVWHDDETMAVKNVVNACAL